MKVFLPIFFYSFINLIHASTFPSLVPFEKPDFALSVAMERLYDQWNPHEDLNNELYSNFKYTPLIGFEKIPFTSRRDPTKSYQGWKFVSRLVYKKNIFM